MLLLLVVVVVVVVGLVGLLPLVLPVSSPSHGLSFPPGPKVKRCSILRARTLGSGRVALSNWAAFQGKLSTVEVEEEKEEDPQVSCPPPSSCAAAAWPIRAFEKVSNTA